MAPSRRLHTLIRRALNHSRHSHSHNLMSRHTPAPPVSSAAFGALPAAGGALPPLCRGFASAAAAGGGSGAPRAPATESEELGANRVVEASLTLAEKVRAAGGAEATACLLGVPLGHNSSFLQGPAFAPLIPLPTSPSFAPCPCSRLPQAEKVRAAGGAEATACLLGVPLGHNSSFLQGPAFAPPRIREAIWCGSTNSATEEDVGDVPVQVRVGYWCRWHLVQVASGAGEGGILVQVASGAGEGGILVQVASGAGEGGILVQVASGAGEGGILVQVASGAGGIWCRWHLVQVASGAGGIWCRWHLVQVASGAGGIWQERHWSCFLPCSLGLWVGRQLPHVHLACASNSVDSQHIILVCASHSIQSCTIHASHPTTTGDAGLWVGRQPPHAHRVRLHYCGLDDSRLMRTVSDSVLATLITVSDYCGLDDSRLMRTVSDSVRLVLAEVDILHLDAHPDIYHASEGNHYFPLICPQSLPILPHSPLFQPLFLPSSSHCHPFFSPPPATQSPLAPLVLGGDHSISFPVVRAVSEHLGGPVDILHFDAHPDIYHAFEGNHYSHASPFARIMESGACRRLLQVG
ncbi:unnamed protein product [Closterium sp. NIES-54]